MNIIISTALIGSFLLPGTAPEAPVARMVETVKSPAYQSRTVLMTGYNAVPEQTNADPTTTASGARSNPDIVAARSRDLADVLPYGTVIEVIVPKETAHTCGLAAVDHLVGYRVVADTMHMRKKNQIDLMFDSHDYVQYGSKQKNAALVMGVCEDIEVRVVGFVDIKKIPRTQTELAATLGRASLALTN